MSDDERTINEMSGGDGDDLELFPQGSLAGDGKSLKNLVKASDRVELTVSMASAEVPAPKDAGLLDDEKEHLILVTCEVANYHPVPIREGDKGEKKKKGYKIRTTLRPIYLEQLKGEVGTIEAGFAALCSEKASDAAALYERLGKRLEAELQKA